MRESDARKIVESAISAAGLKDPWALTLFGGKELIPHAVMTNSKASLNRERRSTAWRWD
jgi:hypothetical protein